MYELEETHDYAPEGTVEGMTVENENVLVLQERDFEQMDEEKLGEYIEESFKDLDVLCRLNTSVLEAIAEPARATQWFLNHAQETRIQLARRYGGSVAMESFYTSTTVVFALEEEEKKEVGIIGRIIDSIVRAFKWLWKKITGVFSSKDPKKKEEGLDDAVKASESAEAAGVEATTADKMADAASDNKEVVTKLSEVMKRRAPKHKKFNELFGWVDPEMSAHKLIDYYKELTKNVSLIEALAKASLNAYNLYEKTVSGAKGSNLESAVVVFEKTIPELVMTPASKMESASADEAKPYFEGSFSEDIVKAYRLKGLVRGKDLYVAQTSPKAGNGFQVVYKALGRFDPSDVSKVKILGSVEQKALSEAVVKFGETLTKLNETMKDVGKHANNPDGLKNITAIFDAADLGKLGNSMRNHLKVVVTGTGSKIINFQKALAMLSNDLNAIHGAGSDWIKECSSVMDELARVVNKVEKEKTKKEGE